MSASIAEAQGLKMYEVHPNSDSTRCAAVCRPDKFIRPIDGERPRIKRRKRSSHGAGHRYCVCAPAVEGALHGPSDTQTAAADLRRGERPDTELAGSRSTSRPAMVAPETGRTRRGEAANAAAQSAARQFHVLPSFRNSRKFPSQSTRLLPPACHRGLRRPQRIARRPVRLLLKFVASFHSTHGAARRASGTLIVFGRGDF